MTPEEMLSFKDWFKVQQNTLRNFHDSFVKDLENTELPEADWDDMYENFKMTQNL